ncbi:MAG: DUF5071 domain-containing protein [Ktedonobacteraceae bacterium]|nr:DUF5071 domain-containing protein [Ktedonobacteraceae bacterium]
MVNAEWRSYLTAHPACQDKPIRGTMSKRVSFHQEDFLLERIGMEDSLQMMRTKILSKKTPPEEITTLLAKGYPALAPLVPTLLEKLQDMNWPNAWQVARFLSTIGRPLLPYVRDILQGDDRVWQYWLLYALVERWDTELVAHIQAELFTLTQLTDKEEVDIAALSQLAKRQLIDDETFHQIVEQKKQLYQDTIIQEELDEIDHVHS